MGRFLGFWLILELNLILFLGVLYWRAPKANVAICGIKYLLTQGLASSIIMLSVLSLVPRNGRFWGTVCVILRFLIKLGVAPFQDWFMRLSSQLRWRGFTLLSTAQKLGPLIGLGHFLLPRIAAWVAALRTVSAMAGVWREPRARKVLAWSSVFNTRWFVLLTRDLTSLMFLYSAYCFGLAAITLGSPSLQGVSLNEGQLHIRSPLTSGFFLFALLNLGGLPPFMGAYFKMIIIYLIAHLYRLTLVVIYLVGSAWFLYVYLGLGIEGLLQSTAQHSKATFENVPKIIWTMPILLFPWISFILCLSVFAQEILIF